MKLRLRSKKVFINDIDDEVIKEFLINIGIQETKQINFKSDEIHEFKNGYKLLT
jgi:hypothetical protein